MKRFLILLGIASLLSACQTKQNTQNMITSSDIQAGVNAILTAYPDADAALVERRVMSLCEVMRFAGVGTKVAMLGVASREL